MQQELRLAKRADNSLDWGRRQPDESGSHQDALGQRALRFAKHIYDFDGMSIGQMCSTKRSKVGKSVRRVLRSACNIKAEFENNVPAHVGLSFARRMAEDYARLLPNLNFVTMALGAVLYESGGKLKDLYFPTTSIVSLLYVMENGASAEIAVTGNEGLVGISLFMGGESAPSRAVVQSAGMGYRLKRLC
jgi:hypothetical protein